MKLKSTLKGVISVLSKKETDMRIRIQNQLYWFPLEQKLERRRRFLEEARLILAECERELNLTELKNWNPKILTVLSPSIYGDASGKEGIISKDLGGYLSGGLFGHFNEDLVGWIDLGLNGSIDGYNGVISPKLKGFLPPEGCGNLTGICGTFCGSSRDILRISGSPTGSFDNIGGDITGIRDCDAQRDVEPLLEKIQYNFDTLG